MNITRKNFAGHVKGADQESGILEAIVNVFNIVDRGNEITRPGLFTESLEKKLPRGVWHHNWARPIAKTLEAKELAPEDPLLPESLKHLGGLYIKAQFVPEITDSWQAFLMIKHGLIDEYSIGYDLSKTARDDESGTIELLKGEWFEWSPVLVGMNQATETLSVKSLADESSRKQFIEGQLGMSLEDHALLTLDVSEGFIARLGRMTEKDMTLSAAAREKAESHLARLKTLLETASSTSQEQQIEQAQLRADIDREFLKSMRKKAGV